MPNPQLLQQLFQLLSESPNFQNMSAEQQEEVKKIYTGADDQDLIKAIDIVQTDSKKVQAELQENEIRQAQAAQEVKETLKKVKAEEIKINQQTEKKESEANSALVLDQLNQKQPSETPPPPDKKKFLGLF